MVAMEMDILRALSWRVHPTTPYCFAQHILFLIPHTAFSLDVRHDIIELARFLTELSVVDYYFVVHRASTVGLASILLAMTETDGVYMDAKRCFYRELSRVDGLDPESDDVVNCYDRL